MGFFFFYSQVFKPRIHLKQNHFIGFKMAVCCVTNQVFTFLCNSFTRSNNSFIPCLKDRHCESFLVMAPPAMTWHWAISSFTHYVWVCMCVGPCVRAWKCERSAAKNVNMAERLVSSMTADGASAALAAVSLRSRCDSTDTHTHTHAPTFMLQLLQTCCCLYSDI